MINKEARPYKAGFEFGKNLNEMADILYLLDNGEQFLTGVKEAIEPKLEAIKEALEMKRRKYAAKVGGP